MTTYLFGVIGLIALYLGFGPVDLHTKKYLFQTTTFYLTGTSLLIWFWTLIPKAFSKQKITPHIPACILAVLLIATIAWLTPHQLRVLYDETNLLGISQALYEQHTFYIPTQALFHNQAIYTIDYEWGVRPLTFPFFLFLIHLIKGYARHGDRTEGRTAPQPSNHIQTVDQMPCLLKQFIIFLNNGLSAVSPTSPRKTYSVQKQKPCQTTCT